MQSVYGRNIHEDLPKAMSLIRLEGYVKGRRASVGPISLEVTNPSERLCYGDPNGLNPFTALFTALWTLGGRSDVQFLAKFDGYRPGSSDDGEVIPGAYGARMRDHFWVAPDEKTGISEGHIDQLKSVVLMIQNHPETCAPVISLWDAGTDLGLHSPNMPSVTHLYLNITSPHGLDMMVVARDADLLGLRLDFLVLSMIQEYIATATGIPLGRMTFVIDSLDVDVKALELPAAGVSVNPYRAEMAVWPLVSTDPDAWLAELDMFLDEGPVMGLRDSFFRHVASPMWQAWGVYQDTTGTAQAGDGARRAIDIAQRIRAGDWRAAATEWLLRKIDEKS